jgi:hypothetical protein
MKRLLLLCISGMLLTTTAFPQQPCSAEVKLLLVPSELQSAKATLHAKTPRSADIYLYDTGSLDLLKQGILLRMRQGAKSDLTVKRRSKDVGAQSADADASCEFDAVAGETYRSLAITMKFSASVPENGRDLFALLSPSQKKLAEPFAIDWKNVKEIAAIKSTTWQISLPPDFPKLSMELWEWNGQSILEISARVPASDVSSGYQRLQKLAIERKLALSPEQETKTALVLQSISHPTSH